MYVVFRACDLALADIRAQQYFNRHSISRSPYDPQHVQHYSPFARTWYSTSELEKHDHVVALSRGNELAQLMDGPDDSDDSDFEAPVASSSKRTLGSTATSPKKKPRFDNTLDAFLTRVRADDRPLGQLAASSIVRGGAYGLIGNAFLVQKARDLLLDEAFDPDDDDEAQEYVNGWEEWKKVVASRVKRGKGDGKPPKGHVWACPKTGKEI